MNNPNIYRYGHKDMVMYLRQNCWKKESWELLTSQILDLEIWKYQNMEKIPQKL